MRETPLWTPSAEAVERANLTRFMRDVRSLGERTEGVADYASLYEWSVRDLELFWTEVWRFCGIVADHGGAEGVACERPLILCNELLLSKNETRAGTAACD